MVWGDVIALLPNQREYYGNVERAKYPVFGLIILIALLVTGCGESLFNADVAFVVSNDEELGVTYTSRLALGEYEDDRYFIWGREADGFSFYVSDVAKIDLGQYGFDINVTRKIDGQEVEPYPEVRKITVTLVNKDNTPVSVRYRDFVLVDPEGKSYFLVNRFAEEVLYKAGRKRMTTSHEMTIKPSKTIEIPLYYETDKNIHQGGWRLRYRRFGRSSNPIFVWAHVAYDKEPVIQQ